MSVCLSVCPPPPGVMDWLFGWSTYDVIGHILTLLVVYSPPEVANIFVSFSYGIEIMGSSQEHPQI